MWHMELALKMNITIYCIKCYDWEKLLTMGVLVASRNLWFQEEKTKTKIQKQRFSLSTKTINSSDLTKPQLTLLSFYCLLQPVETYSFQSEILVFGKSSARTYFRRVCNNLPK